GSVLLLGGLNLLVGAALLVAEPVGRARIARLAGAGMAALAVVGLAASFLDLPVTRTSTENLLRRSGLPVTHGEDELATVDTVGGPPAGRRPLAGGRGETSQAGATTV